MLIIGSHVSPYVRKVLVALGIKGLDYEIDPIVPFFGNDEFTRLSPLRPLGPLRRPRRRMALMPRNPKARP